MKKLLLLFTILIASCSSDDEGIDCGCVMSYYNIEINTIIGSNGLPMQQISYVYQYEEDVECQEEVLDYVTIDQGPLHYRVMCDY